MAKAKAKAALKAKAPEAVQGTVTLLRKITSKTVCGTIEKPEKKTHLYTLSGVVNDTKSGESNFGAWTALLGRFLAQRADGAEFSAPKAHVPEPVSSGLVDAIKAAQREYMEAADRGEKPAMPEVRFSIRVGLIPQVDQSRGGRGYEYVCDTIQAPEQRGALDDLRQLALPAPK